MQQLSYPRPFGSYVLLERLGQGGMSEVDLARRAVDQAGFVRFLVIKRIHGQHTGDDGFLRMFHDEARINAELQHENIASVYDFGQEGEEFFLAMEYVPGCDLRHIQRALARRGEAFPLRMALRIVADVLAALDYAHNRVDTYGRSMNIVHRDVNPRNVMLSVRGEVKLIDFGVAKADNRAEHTVGHSLKGKFAYMAPEQIDGTLGVDGRADLFAVGIVLHELLVGASPFAGLTEVQTMHRILSGTLPPVESRPSRPIPEAVLAVYRQAVAGPQERRWQSAADMRKALVAAADHCGGIAGRGELATFLLTVDPGLGAVAGRLEEWREHSQSQAAAPAPLPANLATPPDTSSSGTLAERGTMSAAAAGAGIGAVVAVTLVLIAAAAGAWVVLGTDLLKPDPTPVGEVGKTRPAEPPSVTRKKAAAGDPTAASGADPATTTTAPGTTSPATGRSPSAGGSGSSTSTEDAAARRDGGDPTASSQSTSSNTDSSQAGGAQPDVPPPSTGASGDAGTTSAAGTTGGDPPPADAGPATAGGSEPAGAGTADPATASSSGTSSSGTSSPATGTTTASSPATGTTSAGTAPASGASGYINVSSRPTGLELRIDGVLVGRTPVRAMELPAGRHDVVVSDPATGQSWREAVQIVEGRAKVVVLGEGP